MAKKQHYGAVTAVSVIRYMGGKTALAQRILPLINAPHRRYIEPFFGAGGIFFAKPLAEQQVLNDLSGETIHFMRTLRDHSAALIRAIHFTLYSRDEWMLARQPCDDPIERARRFYIRQEMSYAPAKGTGWRRNFTMISDRDLPSEFAQIDHLKRAAQKLKRAYIDNRDGIELIQEYAGYSVSTLFYVDPPYVSETRTGGGAYAHEMSNDDHERLAAALHKANENPCMMSAISGYRCQLYDDLYSDWARVDFEVSTTGQAKRTDSLWLSPNLVMQRDKDRSKQMPLF